jgi:hypothetical protein
LHEKVELINSIYSSFFIDRLWPPLIFGIPQDQWDQLNQQQLSQVIVGYNQRSQTEAQVAPLYAVADVLKAKNSAATPSKPFDAILDHHDSIMDTHIPDVGPAF